MILPFIFSLLIVKFTPGYKLDTESEDHNYVDLQYDIHVLKDRIDYPNPNIPPDYNQGNVYVVEENEFSGEDDYDENEESDRELNNFEIPMNLSKLKNTLNIHPVFDDHIGSTLTSHLPVIDLNNDAYFDKAYDALLNNITKKSFSPNYDFNITKIDSNLLMKLDDLNKTIFQNIHSLSEIAHEISIFNSTITQLTLEMEKYKINDSIQHEEMNKYIEKLNNTYNDNDLKMLKELTNLKHMIKDLDHSVIQQSILEKRSNPKIACAKNYYMGSTWDETVQFENVQRSCPSNTVGISQRLCGSKGNWEYPNHTNCSFSLLNELLYNLPINLSFCNEHLTNLSEVLSFNLRFRQLLAGEIINTVKILSFNIALLTNGSIPLNYLMIEKIYKIIDILLDRVNINEWKALMFFENIMVKELLKALLRLNKILLNTTKELFDCEYKLSLNNIEAMSMCQSYSGSQINDYELVIQDMVLSLSLSPSNKFILTVLDSYILGHFVNKTFYGYIFGVFISPSFSNPDSFPGLFDLSIMDKNDHTNNIEILSCYNILKNENNNSNCVKKKKTYSCSCEYNTYNILVVKMTTAQTSISFDVLTDQIGKIAFSGIPLWILIVISCVTILLIIYVKYRIK